MECHPVRHVYRVHIREVWPSSWMTLGAHSEAVSCDYMASELAYTCSHLWGDRLATKDKQNNKTTITLLSSIGNASNETISSLCCPPLVMLVMRQ